MISSRIVDDTKVDVGKELTCNISYFLVSGVEVNGVLIENGFLLS